MVNENTTTLFFGNIAQRMRHEIDLSDITWSMCKASQLFCQEWIHFFFPQLDIAEIEDIYREYSDLEGEGSRADFVIFCKNQQSPFVIEVKIWDHNHHFGQYEKAYRIDRTHLEYITNYKITKEGYDVKQWKEFYIQLKNLLKTQRADNEAEINLIQGYCEYLKNVCNIITMERIIDINKLSGLYDLTIALHSIVELKTSYYTATRYVYKGGDDNANNKRAVCIKLKYENKFLDREFYYPAIGIWFDEPGPRISAGFWWDSGWGKEVCDFMKKYRYLLSVIENKYVGLPFEDYGYWFYMSDYAKEEFSSAKDVNTQYHVLREFLNEVLLFPLKLKDKVESQKSAAVSSE